MNNNQENQEITKVITTIDEQNLSQSNSLENDLFYGDLGEELLFGDEPIQIDNNQNISDALLNNQKLSSWTENSGGDILTEGGEFSLSNSSGEKLDLVQDLSSIINQIYVNEDGFGINLGETELSTKFDFNPSTGTLSYQGQEFLVIKDDGSFEILINSINGF